MITADNSKNSATFRIVAIFAIIILIGVFIFVKQRDLEHEPLIAIYEIAKTIDHLPGSSDDIFEMPWNAIYYDGSIYTTDLSGNIVIRLDYDFSRGEIIGREGRGPGEFLGPAFIRVSDNAVYVAEANNARIQIFDKKYTFRNYIHTRWSPVRTFGLSPNNTVLTYSWHQDFLVHEYNESGDTLARFGAAFGANPNMNRVQIETDSRDNVYIAFLNRPIIRKYNSRRNLVWEKDVSNLRVVSERLEEIKRLDGPEEGYNIISDIVVHKDRLYTHFTGYSPKVSGGIKIYIFRTSDGEVEGNMIIRTDIARAIRGMSFDDGDTLYFADPANAEIVKSVISDR